jgi:hypothetical protein
MFETEGVTWQAQKWPFEAERTLEMRGYIWL